MGPEHVVGEIAPVGAQGPAVGVGGHHRPPGQAHHVPEPRVADVGHVGADMARLQLPQKVGAKRGEAPIRVPAVGAGQDIGPVPHGVEKPHTPFRRRLHLSRVAAYELGPLYGENRRHFPVCRSTVHLCAGAAGDDDVPVLLHLL